MRESFGGSLRETELVTIAEEKESFQNRQDNDKSGRLLIELETADSVGLLGRRCIYFISLPKAGMIMNIRS